MRLGRGRGAGRLILLLATTAPLSLGACRANPTPKTVPATDLRPASPSADAVSPTGGIGTGTGDDSKVAGSATALPVPTLDYAALGLPPDGRTRVEDELTVPELSAAEAGAYLGDRRTVFVDIRQAHEFRAGHIPGARRIQAQVEDGLLAELPLDQRLIVYCACHSRQAMARTAVILRALGGAEVYILDGGLPAWRATGLPVETGDGP